MTGPTLDMSKEELIINLNKLFEEDPDFVLQVELAIRECAARANKPPSTAGPGAPARRGSRPPHVFVHLQRLCLQPAGAV